MALLFVGAALIAVLAGGVAAVAGFGIGSLLTPLVALAYGTKLAVVLVSIPHLVATSLRAWMLRRHVDRGVLLTFGAASAVGGLGGALLHASLGSRALGVVLGVLLLFSGLSGLTGLTARLRINGTGWALATGIVSGGFGGLVGNQGGIRTAALLHFRLEAIPLVATATAIGLAVDFARIPVYLAGSAGEIAANWPLVALMTVGVVVGTVAGTPLLRRLPEQTFRRVVFGLVALLGLAFLAGLFG